MNEKLYAVLFALVISTVTGNVVFGVGYLLSYVVSIDLKTEEQCKELKGFVKDNPENADMIKHYPETANQLRSDNCLEGLELYKTNTMIANMFFPITSFIGSFLMTLRMLYPTKENEPREDFKPVFCDCGKHLYDEDNRLIGLSDVDAVERLRKNGQFAMAYWTKEDQKKEEKI